MVILDKVLLTVMVAASLWTVMTSSVLKSAIGLALTSAILTIMMFRLDSSLAAVFELSVCAGLITAVFVTTISLVKPLTHKEVLEVSKNRIKRYWYLPAIMVITGIALLFLNIPMNFELPPVSVETDVRNVLWNLRQIDLFGQIVVLLAGVFGIVILFKESRKK